MVNGISLFGQLNGIWGMETPPEIFTCCEKNRKGCFGKNPQNHYSTPPSHYHHITYILSFLGNLLVKLSDALILSSGKKPGYTKKTGLLALNNCNGYK